MTLTYLNLTNGLDAAEELAAGARVCRLQSTDIEREDWPSFFASIGHDMLFALARGWRVEVVDFGAGRKPSKVTRIGVPVIAEVLAKQWLDKPTETSRGRDADEAVFGYLRVWSDMDFFRRGVASVSRDAVRYHRRWVADGLEKIDIVGRHGTTTHDADVDWFRGKVSAAESAMKGHA